MRAKYSIRTKLCEHRLWTDLELQNVVCGHAVFLPDVGNTDRLGKPDMPAQLIGSAGDVVGIEAWINTAFEYWEGRESRTSPLGRNGVEVLRETFAKSFFAAPLIAVQLEDQESRRLHLTEEQIRVLDVLRSHRRAAVSGGAGTGKTVLAVEKARRLAREGFHTLLTCYNRQLADHLAAVCAEIPNLDVMSFHQLCYRRADRAGRESGRDLLSEAKFTYSGMDLYDVLLPNALGYALEIIPDRYDAIVCDEGQDFREEYWVPLELMLSDIDTSPLYIFYDDNQNLYARVSTFPILDEPFILSVNCRNTTPIHEGAYRYYTGMPVSPPDNPGDDIQFIMSASQDQQAQKIGARIVDMISRQGVSAGDITVLIADVLRKSDYYRMLGRLPLPKPATWLDEGVSDGNTVLMETVPRFKGLEAPVVILWGLDTPDLEKHPELLYVGISRAKSLLIVVARPETCEPISAMKTSES